MESAVLPSRAVSPPRTKRSWGFREGDEICPGRFALKLLGGGRRYEAYLAYDEALLSTVVVKVLRPGCTYDRAALDAMAAEYRALSRLNHPVICRGFDAVLEGGRPHLVLEFLDGPRLSTLIRRFGPLPNEQLIPLAVQLCSALHYIHGRGLVHLDIKPKNVVMAAPPRLIDFSIARSFEEAASLRGPIGTRRYMAPEQCAPGAGAAVGPEADLWGLGVTLCEAATGEHPFPQSFEERDREYPQLELRPEALGDRVPGPIAVLIEACLQKAPHARPIARELSASLDPLVEALPRRMVLNRLRPRWK